MPNQRQISLMKTRILPFFFLHFLLIGCVSYSQQPDFKLLDEYIGKSVKDFGLTGLSIAIVQKDKVVFTRAYGFADKSKADVLETRDLFNIASCTKAFTAAAIANLVHEGKLKWADPVTDYVPGFAVSDPCITAMTTIEDLLTHRTGLGTFYGDELWYQTDYSPEEIISRMRYLPLKNQFRNQFGYQNNMYIIAGEVIEKVSGLKWSDYIENNFLFPLSMNQSRTSSVFLDPDQAVAMPHLYGKVQAIYEFAPNPAASMYSSVEDLSNWIRMLLGEGSFEGKQVLAADVVRQMFAGRTTMPVYPFHESQGTHFRSYALGWFLFDYGGRKIVEHDGGMPGYISKVCLVPEEELGFTILTNDMTGLPDALRNRILDSFLGKEQKDWAKEYLAYQQADEQQKKADTEQRRNLRVSGTHPSWDPKEFAGTYIDKMYGNAKVNLENGKLFLRLVPAGDAFTSEMEHWHFDTWRIKFKDEFLPEGFVTFDFTSNGKPAGFKIDLPNPDFHFFNLNFRRETN